MKIQRRKFLFLSLSVVSTSVFGSPINGGQRRSDRLQRQIIASSSLANNIEKLGRLFLLSNKEHLKECENLYLQLILTDAKKQDIHLLLSNRYREDFNEGCTVTLDRWVISRTEAASYAIASQFSLERDSLFPQHP